MDNYLLFVLSVLDNGDERTFVTDEVRLVGDNLVVLLGETAQSFKMGDVVDFALVDLAADRVLSAVHCQSEPPRSSRDQPPSDS